MPEPMAPSMVLLCKLGSIIVHAEELVADGHEFDLAAMSNLLADSEVTEWMAQMNVLALLPVRRGDARA